MIAASRSASRCIADRRPDRDLALETERMCRPTSTPFRRGTVFSGPRHDPQRGPVVGMSSNALAILDEVHPAIGCIRQGSHNHRLHKIWLRVTMAIGSAEMLISRDSSPVDPSLDASSATVTDDDMTSRATSPNLPPLMRFLVPAFRLVDLHDSRRVLSADIAAILSAGRDWSGTKNGPETRHSRKEIN